MVTDLRHKEDVFCMFAKQLPNLNQVRTFANKRKSNHVNLVRNSPVQDIFFVLVGQSREVHNNTRKIDILSLTKNRSVLTSALYQTFLLVTRQNSERDCSISTEYHHSRLYILSKLFVAHADRFLITLEAVVSGYCDLLALFQLNRLGIFQEPCSNFWTLCTKNKLGYLQIESFLGLLQRFKSHITGTGRKHHIMSSYGYS